MVQVASLAAPPTKHQKSYSLSQAPLLSCALPAALTVGPSAEPYAGANAKNSQLPPGANIMIWQQNFVPMIIQYISQHLNPWAIPPLQLLPIMQIIWDALFDSIPQMITTTSMIYCLVSYESFWFTKLGLVCSPGLAASNFQQFSESIDTVN